MISVGFYPFLLLVNAHRVKVPIRRDVLEPSPRYRSNRKKVFS